VVPTWGVRSGEGQPPATRQLSHVTLGAAHFSPTVPQECPSGIATARHALNGGALGRELLDQNVTHGLPFHARGGIMDLSDSDKHALDQRVFEYPWRYFALHAGQRMQSVNFFLIATTFLVSAYVAAVSGGHAGLAAGVAVLGALSSFVFYRIERRVRGLIKAAEAALRPLERSMAEKAENPALQILDSVETAPAGAWSYSRVFRALYVMVGLAFVAGSLYATSIQLGVTPGTTGLFTPALRLTAGTILLLFAYETLLTDTRRPHQGAATRITGATAWALAILGFSAGLAGIFVLAGLLK